MAKQKKKRSKAYTGVDAKNTRPSIVRVTAENRGPIKEWRLSHKRQIRAGLIVLGILLALFLLGSGIVGLIR